MSHWLFLPLDGRPCNARFPVELAELAGERLLVPPVEMLGDARTPARRDRLQAWLETHLEGARGLFVSLDTWIYGNLVASRKNRDSAELLLDRLTLLKDFRQQYPHLQIHGFATLLRLSNSHDDTEERPYWAQYGKEIYRFSWLEHYQQLHEGADQTEYQALLEQIPPEVLNDYRHLRSRNAQLLEAMLSELEAGLLETLLIGCDDGGSYGWTVLERQALQAKIDQRELSALVYPGADELASVLIARVLEPRQPVLKVDWTYPEASDQVTRYEGIALRQTLEHQAHAAGVKLRFDEGPFDGRLWLHNPPDEQIDQYLDRDSRVRLEPDRIGPLLEALSAGDPVALADVCYANGGDIQLLERLEREQQLFALNAYAAWNTAGNTLGMLLAWYKLNLFKAAQPRLQQRFLAERLADDGWYQGYLRQTLCAHYSEPVTLNSCIQAIAFFNDKFRNWQRWMPDPPPCLQIEHLSFPWRRFFEVDLRVCTKEL
jgi:hypothetical protein